MPHLRGQKTTTRQHTFHKSEWSASALYGFNHNGYYNGLVNGKTMIIMQTSGNPTPTMQADPAPATKSNFPKAAIFWVQEAYSLGRDVIMGRQSAGAGFIRAVAAAKPDELFCYAKSRADAEAFKRVVQDNGAPNATLHWVPLLRPKGLHQAGLLYRPDANIASDAWRRAAHGGDRAYSICGVTHTTATHTIMESIAALLTAPLHSWDALVCTSHAVRDSVRSVLEATAEHFKERLGATRLPIPQTPFISLGVDCKDFIFSQSDRQKARNELSIAADETVVSFIGRLSFHAKAHHVPMYLALEQAARGQRVVLLQAGWFNNKAIEAAFREEAKMLCPSIRCLFVDGRDPSTRKQVWAATDIFTSLVDNFQETFGLTPIEAMAAGIPSVVSDWDGYRDTVRDGIDGFRIPTLSMPPGTGGDIADRYDWGLDSYDFYMFHGSQLVAVDVDSAAEAYRKLILDPALRLQMGNAGRQRARAMFDWTVIIAKYVALWEELAERRRADPALFAEHAPRRRPDRADPFTMFASYPSSVVGPKMQIKRRAGCTVGDAMARRKLNSTGKAEAVLPPPELIEMIVSKLPDDRWVAFEELLPSCREHTSDSVARAVVWLSKFGVLCPMQPRS
jgi:glycosyltransferase involved in cell wall biosynthesis